MGLFDDLFGHSGSIPTGHGWTPLTELCQVDQAVRDSHSAPVVFFKHSTRCAISKFAWKQFGKEFGKEFDSRQAKLYYLDLLEHRDISDELASRFGVAHQSPQVIVVKEGKAVYAASHETIEARRVIAHF